MTEEEDVITRVINEVMEKVEDIGRAERELAYRRALARVGVMKGSVDILVAKDREWIERGC